MRFFWLVGLSIVAASTPGLPVKDHGNICIILKDRFPENTILPNDHLFANETQVAWSTTSWIEPACIFAPANANQLSFAVQRFVALQTEFAMRGGGHMAIPSSNSIDSRGVLISSTNLDTLAVSIDRNTVSVGAGNKWGDVYEALEGSDLVVLGGRIGPVGVPGVLLGGGVSFYSNEYGLASTNGNIQGYECVLADGSIIEATADNDHADLFWALQGGGNSFCLVTRFDLKTYYSPITMISSYIYGSSEIQTQYLDSVFNFATQGHADPKAAIIPMAQFVSGRTGPDYSSILFYNGNNTRPPVLGDWLGKTLTPVNGSSELQPFSLAQFSRAVRPAFDQGGYAHGLRQRFHLLPIIADREAMQVVHDTFFNMAQVQFANTEGGVAGIAFNPMTSKLLSATNAKPGAPQGLDETSSFWIEQVYSWKNAADDALVDDFVRTFNADVLGPLKALNATGSFYYMNEADEGQPVFEYYPPRSLQRLKEIRSKYDPARVYTDLMPGGFKVAAA